MSPLPPSRTARRIALAALACLLAGVGVACDRPDPMLRALDAPEIDLPGPSSPGPSLSERLPPELALLPDALRGARDDDGDALFEAPPEGENGELLRRRRARRSFADTVELVRPAVVNIYTTQQIEPGELNSWSPIGTGGQRDSQSLGSGFLIDEDGLILTSGHVIERARQIRVVLSDGRNFDAEVVGLDRATDIALVRIPSPGGVEPLPLGDSSSVRVGDWVLAVGNPFGLASTVTAGIVSAMGRRDLELGRELTLADFLQTDASINPGNSGGPLVNMHGEVVGINTAINREGQGIGFAIPIHVAQAVIQPLRDEGRVRRAWLGIHMTSISDAVAGENELESGVGVRVTRVAEGGPAYRAGLRQDDLLLTFNRTEIRSTTDLRWTVGMAGIGTRVPIEIMRNGQRRTIHATLGRMPDPDED